MLLSDLIHTTAVSSLNCRHPSIRTLGERLMRSVHVGVLGTGVDAAV